MRFQSYMSYFQCMYLLETAHSKFTKLYTLLPPPIQSLRLPLIHRRLCMRDPPPVHTRPPSPPPLHCHPQRHCRTRSPSASRPSPTSRPPPRSLRQYPRLPRWRGRYSDDGTRRRCPFYPAYRLRLVPSYSFLFFPLLASLYFRQLQIMLPRPDDTGPLARAPIHRTRAERERLSEGLVEETIASGTAFGASLFISFLFVVCFAWYFWLAVGLCGLRRCS
ncbi:hypothetical protein MSAN_01220100 [Mycena sanguinolenta]|uniref:Uncharacterized protein n=1 Tax=Mycena sanguinolenta TaxID=230812 RepID=A0A8H6YFL4_9AGAR|nr:hypothetical protein MSAN_01220100 [Mycena sanguinolenta]